MSLRSKRLDPPSRGMTYKYLKPESFLSART